MNVAIKVFPDTYVDSVAQLSALRAMRQVEERIAGVRLERDRRVREAVAGGASYREVAKAIGLSHSRIQQIVNETRR